MQRISRTNSGVATADPEDARPKIDFVLTKIYTSTFLCRTLARKHKGTVRTFVERLNLVFLEEFFNGRRASFFFNVHHICICILRHMSVLDPFISQEGDCLKYLLSIIGLRSRFYWIKTFEPYNLFYTIYVVLAFYQLQERFSKSRHILRPNTYNMLWIRTPKSTDRMTDIMGEEIGWRADSNASNIIMTLMPLSLSSGR